MYCLCIESRVGFVDRQETTTWHPSRRRKEMWDHLDEICIGMAPKYTNHFSPPYIRCLLEKSHSVWVSKLNCILPGVNYRPTSLLSRLRNWPISSVMMMDMTRTGHAKKFSKRSFMSDFVCRMLVTSGISTVVCIYPTMPYDNSGTHFGIGSHSRSFHNFI